MQNQQTLGNKGVQLLERVKLNVPSPFGVSLSQLTQFDFGPLEDPMVLKPADEAELKHSRDFLEKMKEKYS